MKSVPEEHDLLLDTVDRVTAELARGLLEEAQIPTLFHSPDFDVAELGVAAHQTLRGVSVYVPRGQRARAQAILDEAWGSSPPGPPQAGESEEERAD